jgi:hypothetical protein
VTIRSTDVAHVDLWLASPSVPHQPATLLGPDFIPRFPVAYIPVPCQTMADEHERPRAGPFAVTTAANGTSQGQDATGSLPTLIAFRVTPEGNVILHVTQSMDVPKTQGSYYTRVFWVGPKALSTSLNEQIRQYFDAEEGHVPLKESLLSATLLAVYKIMGQDMFKRHWIEDAGHVRFECNTESSLYPMIGYPGGRLFPPGNFAIDKARWHEQRHLTKAIENASDRFQRGHQAYTHWFETDTSGQIALGSVSLDEIISTEIYQVGSASIPGNLTGSIVEFDPSMNRLSPMSMGYPVIFNSTEFTPFSFASDESRQSKR